MPSKVIVAYISVEDGFKSQLFDVDAEIYATCEKN